MAAPESPPRSAAAAPRPSWNRRRTWILLGLLAFGAGARALLPEVARRVIESQAGAALGRKVEIADVDLGLLTGRAQVEGIAIGGPDRSAPIDPAAAILRCANFGAQIAWLPLLTGRIHLREIALAQPMLRLDRTAQGRIAPIVLAEPAHEPPAPPEEESGGGIDLAIDRIALDGAELRLVSQRDLESIAELRFQQLSLGDLSYREEVIGLGTLALRGPDLDVNSERLSEPEAEAQPATPAVAAAPPSEPAPSARTPAKHRVEDLDIENMRFGYRLPNGEVIQAELELHARQAGIGEAFPLEVRLTTDKAQLALDGQLAIGPIAFDGQFQWENLQLQRSVSRLPDAPVKIASGTSSGKLEIALRLAPEAPPGVAMHGDAQIDDLEIATPDGAASVRWKQLAIALQSFEMRLDDPAAAPQIHLSQLTLDAPEVDYQRKPGEPAPPPAEQAAAPAAAEGEGPVPRVEIDRLELRRGALRFRDQSVRPAVDTALRELEIRAQGVRWPERDVEKIRLTAKGQRAATLKLEGGVVRGAGAIDLDLRELPLASFDPYAGQATGLKIDGGRLSLQSRLTLDAQRLGAKTRLGLHQLAVSERESGWFQQGFGMPLDMAVALLQDLEGNIALPIDVEQDAGGTRMGIGKAVAAALRQALVGALAAPLKLLGGMASRGGGAAASGLAPIPMAPGDGELTPEAHERLAQLAELLASRPGLGVLLVGRSDASDDAPLARRELLALARTEAPLPGENELGFFERRRVRRALADADPEQLAALDPEVAAALDRMAGGVQVPDAKRQELARARAQAVARALQEQHGASAAVVSAIETETGAPSVEIELRAGAASADADRALAAGAPTGTDLAHPGPAQSGAR